MFTKEAEVTIGGRKQKVKIRISVYVDDLLIRSRSRKLIDAT